MSPGLRRNFTVGIEWYKLLTGSGKTVTPEVRLPQCVYGLEGLDRMKGAGNPSRRDWEDSLRSTRGSQLRMLTGA